MRVSILLTSIFAATVLFSACKKSDSEALPTNYRIDGVQDLDLSSNTGIPVTGYMSLAINSTGKLQEHVDLSLEGVPEGCGATITSPGGFPNFSTNIIFRDSNANGGTYPVKLVCNGSVTGKKSYTFNLKLPTLPDCSTWLLRSYVASTACGGGSGGSYSEMLTASGVRNRLVFNNFEGTGINIYANISCQSGYNVSIPEQTINGVEYSGYGYATASYIYLYYNKISSSGSIGCTMNMY